MDNELISVIVPVYNVEKYLIRCVNSLLNQTYSNYEILLIDDGSTDGSAQLCENLAENNKIKVFHKKNGGLGSARNYGINKASGSYLCFIDSDDFVTHDYLEKLYIGLISNKADLCISGYYYSTEKITTTYLFINEILNKQETLKLFAGGNPFLYFAWNKLYKKEIIDIMPMHFSARHCAEDMYFNLIYYQYVNRIAVIESPLYYYFVNMQSLSNGRRKHFWEDMLIIYDEFYKICITLGLKIEYANNLLVVLLRNSISNFFNGKVTIAEYNHYINECLEIRDISKIKIIKNKLGRIDRMVYKAVKNQQIFNVFIYMKIVKWLKLKHFKIFCKIRGSVSRRK